MLIENAAVSALATAMVDATLTGPLDWKAKREKITRLYLSHSVKHIKKAMEEEDFFASEKQYEKKLQMWKKLGVIKGKTAKSKLKDRMVQIRGTRAKIGKLTGFTFNGETFSDAKLNRHIMEKKRKEADPTSRGHCSGETPDEIKYFTPEATCPSINPVGCGAQNIERALDASPWLPVEHISGDRATFLDMTNFPISNNVDSKSVRKNPCSSDMTVEPKRAESLRVIGASLPHPSPQSILSLFASLQDNVDGAILLDSNEINSERHFAAKEQKKIASAMTPESVWRLVPSLTVTANPVDLTVKADLKQRAMKAYEKHYGRSVYDPKGMRYKADELWEFGRYGDAEELDRLTVEVANEKFGADHLYTLKLKGDLAAAIWGQGRLEEAEKIESEVVKKMRDILGEYDEYTLQYMGNLSCTYRAQGKWQQATNLGLEVVRNAILRFGLDHQDTLAYMCNLARACWLQERWTDAAVILKYVSEARRNLFGFEEKQTLQAYAALARTLQQQGNWKEAEEIANQVSQARKSKYQHLPLENLDSMEILANIYVALARTNLLAARHPHTLSSRQDLAAVLFYQEKYVEAETIGSEVLGTRKEVLGSRHPDTLTSMADLCWLHSSHMPLEIVEKEFSEVLWLRQSILGEEHPDTLASQSSRAWVYTQRGRWKAAEALYTHIQQLRQKIPDSEKHPDFIRTLLRIAETLQKQGEPRKAEELYRKSYDLSRHQFGEGYRDTLLALSSLSNLLSGQGRYQEAEAAIDETLLVIKKNSDYSQTYQLYILRAEIYLRCQQKRWDDSARLLLQLLSRLQKFSEGTHPAIPSTKAELAMVRSFQSRFVEAETLFLEARNETRSTLGSMHPETVDRVADLAWLRVKQKRWKEAVSLYNEILAMIKETLGEQHQKTISITMNLAEAYAEMGSFSEAEKLFNLVSESRKSELGAEDPGTLDAVSMIAWLRTKQSRWSDAADLYKAILGARKKIQGSQHPDTLLAMGNVALASVELGNLLDAENLYELVFKSHVSVFGGRHPVTLKTMQRIAYLRYKQSRFSDAEHLYKIALQGYENIGSCSPEVVVVTVSLAQLSRDQCKVYQAEKEGEQAVSFGNRHLGGDHPEVRAAKFSLAMTKQELGKLSEAGGLYDEVLESESKSGDPESLERLNIMFRQGLLLNRQGNFDEAELILERTLQGRKKLLGGDDPGVLETMKVLADVWRQTDKLLDAETLQCKVLAKQREIFGDCSLPVSESLARLAFIMVGQRRHIEAEEVWERGIQMQRTFVTESNNGLLKNVANLACTKYRLGKLAGAEDLLQSVILCREQNADGATPELLNDLGCLATAKCALVKFAEAVGLQRRAVKMAEMLYGERSAKHSESLQQLLIIQAEHDNWWRNEVEFADMEQGSDRRDELEGEEGSADEDGSDTERLELEASGVEDDDDAGINTEDQVMKEPD